MISEEESELRGWIGKGGVGSDTNSREKVESYEKAMAAEDSGGLSANKAAEQEEEGNTALFPDKMIFPWMFDESHALKHFKDAAHLLVEKEDWPPLYDISSLNSNRVFPLIKTLTFNIICSLLFGLEHGTRREKLVEWFEEMVEARGPVISLTTFNRSIRASSRIQNMIMDIISEKKLAVEEQVVSPDQKDLITNLLSMHREDNSALRCTTWSPGSHGSYA